MKREELLSRSNNRFMHWSPGKVPKHLARIYNDLFERQQEGNYIDFVTFVES